VELRNTKTKAPVFAGACLTHDIWNRGWRTLCHH
jgi:hypothetical protein